jgi:hypothetical protein
MDYSDPPLTGPHKWYKTTVAHKCNTQIYFKHTNISQTHTHTQIYLARVQMDTLFIVALPMRRSHMNAANL